MADNENPAGEQPAASGETSPKYLTSEDFDKAFNKAFSAREKRSNESFAKLKNELLSEVKALLKPAEPEDASDEPGEQTTRDQSGRFAKSTQGDAATDPTSLELAKLRKRLERAEREREEEKRAREEESQKRLRDEEISSLHKALTQAGADPSSVRFVVSTLYSEDKRIGRDAEGRIVFRHDDEEMSLESGVKAWLSTDEGKRFLPPRGASGSGAERGSPPRMNGQRKMTPAEEGALILSLMNKPV
jgi:hypothetical protein